MENWSKPGPDSYIAKAGLDSSYFDMGEQWQRLEDQYGLTGQEMFNMFNKPFLDDAIRNRIIIRFSHDPRKEKGFLLTEWEYLKEKLSLREDDLYEQGGFWYVR